MKEKKKRKILAALIPVAVFLLAAWFQFLVSTIFELL